MSGSRALYSLLAVVEAKPDQDEPVTWAELRKALKEAGDSEAESEYEDRMGDYL